MPCRGENISEMFIAVFTTKIVQLLKEINATSLYLFDIVLQLLPRGNFPYNRAKLNNTIHRKICECLYADTNCA